MSEYAVMISVPGDDDLKQVSISFFLSVMNKRKKGVEFGVKSEFM